MYVCSYCASRVIPTLNLINIMYSYVLMYVVHVCTYVYRSLYVIITFLQQFDTFGDSFISLYVLMTTAK